MVGKIWVRGRGEALVMPNSFVATERREVVLVLITAKASSNNVSISLLLIGNDNEALCVLSIFGIIVSAEESNGCVHPDLYQAVI
jgi:hypothetical protein